MNQHHEFLPKTIEYLSTNKSFMEIWHSKEFIELREAHLKLDIKGTKCEKCALF